MFAAVIIAAVTLGLDGEQQADLDSLIESRQAARVARLESAAAVRDSRLITFHWQQAQQAKERKAVRQSRLVSMRYGSRAHGPTTNMALAQRAVMAEAYRRQFTPVRSYPMYGAYGR